MATTIAVSGKGGSGKTTMAALMVRVLMASSGKAVLAVDADPNSCLGLTMGVTPENTVAEVREKVRGKKSGDVSGSGTDKLRTIEYDIQQAVTEAKGFDLLTMGRPEGPDCYCAVNNFLRKFLDELSSGYEYVVVDNEAGMEHLSRRTTNNVDLLCIIAESTPLGAVTAQRISELTAKLPIVVKQSGVIWNRTENAKQAAGVKSLGCVPYDETVFEASMQGKTIFDLEPDSVSLAAIRKIVERELKLVNM
jgi:CO dehydrogenase maturation factor